MPRRFFFLSVLMALGLLALCAQGVWADDCSSMADCEGTMGYNMVLAILGGLVALGSGLMGHVVTTQFSDPGQDRPSWSLMRRPTPEAEWEEESQGWQPREGEGIGDRPEWSLMNRPSPDHDWGWDPVKEEWGWMEKDTLHAQRMEREGYEFDQEHQVWKPEGYLFDPDSGTWREPPASVDPLEIAPEPGDVTRLELKPGFLGYDESTETLDERRSYLAEQERRAQDGVEEMVERIRMAEESGDAWLADQLRGRRDEALGNLEAAQRAQEELEGRVQARREEREEYEERYRDWSILDVGSEILRFPLDRLLSIFSRSDPLLEDSVLRAHETARELREMAGTRLEPGWLFLRETKSDQPGVLDRFDQISQRRSALEKQIRQAQEKGDVEAGEAALQALRDTDGEFSAAQEQMNRYQDLKEIWARRAYEANLHILRKEGEVIGDLAQVPGTARTLTNLIDAWRRGILPGQYRSRMTAAESSSSLPEGPRGRTPRDMELDMEHFRNVSEGTNKVTAWSAARGSGVPDAELREKVIGVLEDYQGKQTQKYATSSIRREWEYDVDRFRDQPLFRELAREMEGENLVALERTPAGERVRAVRGGDLKAAGGPGGTDLDIGSDVQIVDATTLRPVDPRRIQTLVDRSARRLGFDPEAQEIKFIGSRTARSSHPEAFPIQDGADASTMYDPQQVARMDGFDAETARGVSDYKHHEAQHLGPADALTEQCRKTVQDYDRVTKTLLADRGHAVPRPFENVDEGFKVIREVAEGAPPGTARARFREITGIELDEGCRRINSLQESLVKLDPRGPGRPPLEAPDLTPEPVAGPAPHPVDWSDYSDIAELAKRDPTPAQLHAQRFEEMIARGEEPPGRPLAGRSEDDWIASGDDWRMKAAQERGDQLRAALEKDPNLADRNARFEQAVMDAKKRVFRELHAEHRMEILAEGDLDAGSPILNQQAADRVFQDPRYHQGERLMEVYREEIARQGMSEADEAFILKARGEAKYGHRMEGGVSGDPGQMEAPRAPPYDWGGLGKVGRGQASQTGHDPLAPGPSTGKDG